VEKTILGSVKVEKKVLADIVVSAIKDIEGVRLADKTFFDRILEIFGSQNIPQVVIRIEKDNQVTFEIKICIQYGQPLTETAQKVQNVIKSAVEKTVDIHLKEIHVNIQGIERGKQ